MSLSVFAIVALVFMTGPAIAAIILAVQLQRRSHG